MSGDWKAGDVARSDHAGISVVVERCDKHFARGPHWHHMSGGWDQLDDALSRGKFRPLVVIDPEDREQVRRLDTLIYSDRFDRIDTVDGTQAALREFAAPTPPKPDEPLGLGAVVEEGDDPYTYVRVGDRKRPWLRVGTSNHVGWSEIDGGPIRVLSEGVS